MNTTVKELKDNQVELTVTIDAKEVDDRIAKTYKDFSYKYNFPGFRRGHAPRPVIDNVLGPEAVLATVTDDVVQECYPLAVDESGVSPISKPEVEDQDALVASGEPFSFTVKLTKKPELELSSYDPVEIELPGEAVTEEEVDLQIESLREHYFEFEDAPAGAKVEEGGYADIAMTATDEDGAPIDSLTSESRLYVLGSGLFPAEFDQHLIGLKKGGEAEFDLEFKGLYTAGLASIAGQYDKVHFVVKVIAVKEKALPEVTDEWAKETCGFESLEDLKGRIADSIAQTKETELPRLKEDRCVYALGERLEGDVPEAMAQATEADLLQTFFQQLQSQGMTMDAYLVQAGITMDQFREDVKRQALENTRQDLALDAWARHKGIQVSDAELSEEFAGSGVDDPKALEAEWRSSGRLHTLREGMLRVSAVKDLMETAVVHEPGTMAAPAKKAAKKEAPAKASPAKKEAPAKAAVAAKAGAAAKKTPAPKKAAPKKTSTEKVEKER